MRLTDGQIIEGLRTHNNETIQYVYDQYYRMCQYIVSSNNGRDEDSKDIFQESLLVIIEKVSKFDFELTSQFQTFLFAVINNLWKLQLLKRRNAEKYAESQVYIESTNSELIESYDQQLSSSMLWKCFNKLTKDCQTILNLWWRGYSQKEIADVLSYKYGYLRRKKMNCDESLSCVIKENSELMEIFEEDPALISQVNCA